MRPIEKTERRVFMELSTPLLLHRRFSSLVLNLPEMTPPQTKGPRDTGEKLTPVLLACDGGLKRFCRHAKGGKMLGSVGKVETRWRCHREF